MSKVIFISGLLETNSGKTTFASQVLSYFQSNSSLSIAPFKPLSGNNFFLNYETIISSIFQYSHFLSLDVLQLIKSLPSSIKLLNPLIANPVHKLHTHAIASRFFFERHLDAFLNRYLDSVPLLQRFSFIISGKLHIRYIVNSSIFNNSKFLAPHEIIDRVFHSADEVIPYNSELEYYSLNQKFYADAVQSSFSYLTDNFDVIIIESFNNSAHPAWCVRESDIIFIVSPGSLFVFEPDEYFRAIDNINLISHSLPTKTTDVLKIAKPLGVFEIPINSNNAHVVRNILNDVLGSI